MFNKFDKYLTLVETGLISVAILAASLILFSNVVLRYVFSLGLVWAEESVRYIIVWLTFIGGSVAVARNAHLSVGALVESLSGQAKKWVLAVSDALFLSFAVFLTVWGWQFTAHTMATGQVSPAMLLPMWIVYLAIPLGGALMSLRLVQSIYRTWYGQEKGKASGKEVG